MRALQPPVIAGIALLVLGGLWLLRNLGLLGTVPVAPVVLITVGVFVLAAGLRGDDRDAATFPMEPARIALDGATRARVILEHGAGTLRLGAGSDPELLLEGRIDGNVRPQVQRVGDTLEVRLRPSTGDDASAWIARGQALSWDLALGPEVSLDLDVRTGASRVRADMTGLTVERLRLRTGASEVDLVLPDRGRCATSISAGAAEVRVRIPPTVAAAVRNRTALASFTIDEHRFPRTGDGYRSVDYDSAPIRADLDVEGGVASFSVH